MLSSFCRKSLLTKNFLSIRPFSTTKLLKPILAKIEPLLELDNSLISDHVHAMLQYEHTLFNDQCKSELQEMNKNIIENIVASGGTDGWHTDLNSMTKVFEFTTFEEC